LKPWHNHGPLPTLPVRVLQFPLFAPLSHTNNMNINLHSSIAKVTFYCIKEVLHVSEIYYSTSTDGYQLSIAHLVDKDN
jgi:hypothetical protein